MDEQADVPEPKPGEDINHAQHAKYHWGVPSNEARRAWLRELAGRQKEWVAQSEATRGDSVLQGVRLTGADVLWLAARALAGPKGDLADAAARLNTEDPSERDTPQLWALHLEGAFLAGAHLEGAFLAGAHLERVFLAGAHLEGANVRYAHLEGAFLGNALLQGAHLTGAHLERAHLGGAHLERAFLGGAHLEGANVRYAHLERTFLSDAHLEGAFLGWAHLDRAELWRAHLDVRTVLTDAVLDSKTQLAHVVWNDVALTRVGWENATTTGDKHVARQSRDSNSKNKGRTTRPKMH
jgi:uncharacterized protein YjbI with pentapeptide repeats